MWAESTPNQGQARAKPGPSQGRIQSSHSSSVVTSRYMRCETCFLFIPLLAFLSAYTDIALSNLLGTVSTHTLTPTHTHTPKTHHNEEPCLKVSVLHFCHMVRGALHSSQWNGSQSSAVRSA